MGSTVKYLVPVGTALALATAGCLARPGSKPWTLELGAGSPIRGVRRANAIAVGDFNRDSRPDVAVLGGDPGELFVLLNRGAGLLEPSPGGVIALGRGASGLAAGDLDLDGACDIVVSNHDSFEVVALRSAGDGNFVPFPSSPVAVSAGGTPHSHSVVLADMDHDGRLDLVQAQSEKNEVLVLLGDGAGGFGAAPGSPYAAGDQPYTVVVSDLDGDGALDFASPNAAGGDLTIGLGDGRGAFLTQVDAQASLGGRGLGLAAGDVDDDGAIDLVANLDDQAGLRVLLGDGTGTFRVAGTLAARGRCYGQAIHDLDGDGLDDVVVPCIDARAVAVWLGRSGGPSEATLRSFSTPDTDSQVLAIADLDGDGLADVVTAGWEEPTISVLFGRTSKQRR